MKTDKLVVVVVFLVAVAAVVGFQMLPNRGVEVNSAPDTPGSPSRPAGEVGQFRGISLQLQGNDPTIPYEKYIDEIAATGANTVSLVVAAYQENCRSTSLFIEARKVPPERRIRKLITHARRRGLRVVFMPIVLLENPGEAEWRGKINPTNWNDWWEDYTNYILYYARLCAETGAEVFVVGSELVSTEDQTDRWRKLIRHTRSVYKGLVTYSANWDHYTEPKWWGELDIIGMTSYYDLTGGDKPTVERLLKSWRKIKADIRQWQATVNRPILFTEVGWPNQVTCAQFPWDYYRSTDKPDPTAQANCFEAFFRTWHDDPIVAGWLVWEWRNYPGQKLSPEDTSYVPCGKPAMEVIRKYLTMPTRDAAATKPAGTAPAAPASAAISRRPAASQPAAAGAGR